MLESVNALCRGLGLRTFVPVVGWLCKKFEIRPEIRPVAEWDEKLINKVCLHSALLSRGKKCKNHKSRKNSLYFL